MPHLLNRQVNSSYQMSLFRQRKCYQQLGTAPRSSHLSPPVGITVGISEQSHAYLNQQKHRAESRAHQFSDEVSKGAVEIEHSDV